MFGCFAGLSVSSSYVGSDFKALLGGSSDASLDATLQGFSQVSVTIDNEVRRAMVHLKLFIRWLAM